MIRNRAAHLPAVFVRGTSKKYEDRPHDDDGYSASPEAPHATERRPDELLCCSHYLTFITPIG